jgi:hypothetical protein
MLSQFKKLMLLTPVILMGCGGDIVGDYVPPHACEENTGVSIREPTSDISYSVSTDHVTIQGVTWVDKHYYDCFPCTPDLSQIKVIVANTANGYSDEAYDWLYLGILGYTHYWYEYVPVNPGVNRINATLYFMEQKDGFDCIDINYVPDVIPPSIPANVLTQELSSTEIRVTWDASSDNAVTDDASVRYRVYRDGLYIYTVDETYTENSGLNHGQTYCYVISAIDTAGNESLQSAPSCSTTLP